MQGKELVETKEERDLGIITADKLKPAAQCARAARTAQTVLGQITRSFYFRDKEVFLALYNHHFWAIFLFFIGIAFHVS